MGSQWILPGSVSISSRRNAILYGEDGRGMVLLRVREEGTLANDDDPAEGSMTAQQFIRAIENCYGPYRDGMRLVVEDWAGSCTSGHLDALVHEVVRTHDSGFPPTLAKLIDIGADLDERFRYPLLPEPPLTDPERQEMAEKLAALFADLTKQKILPKKSADEKEREIQEKKQLLDEQARQLGLKEQL